MSKLRILLCLLSVLLLCLLSVFWVQVGQHKDLSARSAQRSKSPDEIAVLIGLLRSPDRAVRTKACRSLGWLRAEQSVGPLVDLLVNDDSSRGAAGEALAAIGAPGRLALIQLLQQEKPEVAAAAAEYLGKMRTDTLASDRTVMDALIEALKRDDESILDSAVVSLGNFKDARAVDAILETMRKMMHKHYAAESLARVGKLSLPPLIDAINKHENFAGWAAQALGEIGDPAAIDALHKLALSGEALSEGAQPHGVVIDYAGLRMAMVDTFETLEISPVEWWKNTEDGIQAAYALSKLGKPALPALINMMSNPQKWVRWNGVHALYAFNQREAVREPEPIIALLSRLKDDDGIVRRNALRTLKSITGATTVNEVFYSSVYSKIDDKRASNAVAMAVGYQGFVEENLVRVFGFASEQQRLAYVASLQGLWHPYCMLVGIDNARSMANSVLHLKGIVLDSLTEDSQTAARNDDASVEVLADQVNNAKEPLRSKPGTAPGKARRAFATSLLDVQTALPQESVLMEYIRYPHYLSHGKFEPRYGVVLIGSPMVAFTDAKPSEPVWVPLGSAETIERNLKEYGALMRGGKRGEVSLLRTLCTQLFEPIQKRLPKGITTLVISPDAELNFMSFATLVDEQDRFLGEQYTIKYVASGRDLVFGRAGKKGSRRLAAFANPAFGEKPAVAGASDTNVVHLAMMTTDQRDYAGVTLAPLPNTLQEGEFLRERSSAWNMQGVMYAGAEATEAEVKAVKSPYILHLATHGFFLPDTLPTNQPAMDNRLLGQERMPVVLHNPMQRSGLAFAGAQLTLDAWKRGETPDPENDGILMAQEVGTMDLKETWLVVLSACDTGVGEARAGEGVLGLRRGFIQAGAQNLMMTLWPVSDKWTVEMMKAFYDRALKEGDAPGALAQVQREYLVKLREEKNPVMAARLAGPFVMTFQGGQPQ